MMDKSTIFLSYLVLTLAVAICLTVMIYYELSYLYIQHQILVNISLMLGIMTGIIVSFTTYTLQQHFNKRKIQV